MVNLNKLTKKAKGKYTDKLKKVDDLAAKLENDEGA